MLSVGSDDEDGPAGAAGEGKLGGAGKPKLRRVESLNNLKGDGEEGGLGPRGRSLTSAYNESDALGMDLAAVVTHLKQVCPMSSCFALLSLVGRWGPVVVVSATKERARKERRHFSPRI